MTKDLSVGVFTDESDILAATEATRAEGYLIVDVYTPYAVHGLPEAMGLAPSRLTWICFALAMCGFTAAILAQFWIAGVNWPINVGGKPFNSLPAYLPVMFECIVLAGGVGVTLIMLARNRLYPGKPEQLIHPDVTNHRFALAVEQRDSSFDLARLTTLWERRHVVEIIHLPEALQ